MLRRHDVVVLKGHPRLTNPFRVSSVTQYGEWAVIVKLREPRSGNAQSVKADGLELLGLRLADTIKTDLLHMLECSVFNEDMNVAELRSARNAIKSFADLHDFMDANELGLTADVWNMMERLAEEPPDDYLPAVSREDAAVQYKCDVVNVAQEEVHNWIELGGLVKV